jgi:hypothetical protein
MKKDRGSTNGVRRDQYWAIHKDGKDNGDLILGKVLSVPKGKDSGGERFVILENLCGQTGRLSHKKLRVLCERNRPISEKEAKEVLEVFKKEGKSAARKKAVEITHRNKQPELPLEPKLREIARPSTAVELNQNVRSLVNAANMKLQLVLAEFTAKLLDLAKAAL